MEDLDPNPCVTRLERRCFDHIQGVSSDTQIAINIAAPYLLDSTTSRYQGKCSKMSCPYSTPPEPDQPPGLESNPDSARPPGMHGRPLQDLPSLSIRLSSAHRHLGGYTCSTWTCRWCTKAAQRVGGEPSRHHPRAVPPPSFIRLRHHRNSTACDVSRPAGWPRPCCHGAVVRG